MENNPHRRRQTSSGDGFSFPINSSDDDQNSNDFEFGSCLTPDAPASSTAAADHLFFNGRLLPHSFPFRPRETAASRASCSSSLLSSRSTSSNSSTSSSARTSSSGDSSVSALLYRQYKAEVSAQVYGSSLRWQFMPGASAAVVVPAGLSRDTSRRRNANKKKKTTTKKSNKKKKQKKVGAASRRPRWKLCRRIFRWFVSACKECHAIEPRPRKKSK